MIKSSLLRARAAFESFCLENAIVSSKVNTDPKLLAFFVPDSSNEQVKKVEKFLSESARQSALQFRVADLPTGRLYVLVAGTLSEAAMADLADDTAIRYNSFHTKLSEILGLPTKLQQSDNTLKQEDQFSAEPEIKPVKKNMDTKIEEALDGIATPDNIQPQQGLKSLFSALKQSGLAQELKKNGVSWHVAEPGKHAVTFIKGKIPILQLTSLELGDAKKLGEILSQLTSIAQGKAPQAAQLELDRVKEMAARANDRKGALDDIAQQFAVPKPEEQQPINLTGPQV